MKRFVFKITIYILSLLILDVVLCAVVDPYNVMHTSRIRDNGVVPNKNYIKMTYILRNPDKFDSFIFGSSRVGNIHVEKIQNEKCYNMNYSMGTPEENLNNIKTLIASDIVPRKIYLGVDSLSYMEDPANHLTAPDRIPYEYIKDNPLSFYTAYFDPEMVYKAIISVIKGHVPTEDYVDIFYNFGWNIDYNHKTDYDFSNAEPSVFPGMRMDEALGDIDEIVKLCDENNIELVVFTNPMYYVTYKASLDRDYLLFLERLAYITPYYNFSGYNKINNDSSNYIETSHYTAEVSDLLINVMCNGVKYDNLYDEGFGMYVDSNNIDKFLEILGNQKAPE